MKKFIFFATMIATTTPVFAIKDDGQVPPPSGPIAQQMTHEELQKEISLKMKNLESLRDMVSKNKSLKRTIKNNLNSEIETRTREFQHALKKQGIPKTKALEETAAEKQKIAQTVQHNFMPILDEIRATQLRLENQTENLAAEILDLKNLKAQQEGPSQHQKDSWWYWTGHKIEDLRNWIRKSLSSLGPQYH